MSLLTEHIVIASINTIDASGAEPEEALEDLEHAFKILTANYKQLQSGMIQLENVPMNQG